jgi:hypothetical protein
MSGLFGKRIEVPRGYPAFWLYAFHLKHNHTFCMRAKTRQNLIIKDFIKSNKREAFIALAG